MVELRVRLMELEAGRSCWGLDIGESRRGGGPQSHQDGHPCE